MKNRLHFLAKISCLLVLVFGVSQQSFAVSKTIANDTFWKDTDGNYIYSQGGNILKVGDTYYWYGAKYRGAVTYAANPVSKNGDTKFLGVTAYSSKDLATWKFEGNVIDATVGGTVFETASWVGRLGVVYNQSTQKYVLVTQFCNSTLEMGCGVAFATSSSPTGTFTYDHLQLQISNVINPSTGDQSTFVDDDGQAYLVFSNANGRARTYVAPFRSSDSLNIEPATQIFRNITGGREGNAMFKYNGMYYVCSSDLHGWNASHTYCIKSANIYGPYSAEFIMNGTDADFSHVTQTGFFISVQGNTENTILFAGDRWSDFAGNGIGYNQWLPLSFNGQDPTMNSLSEYTLDTQTGSWAVGDGNNYILNPTYEADRINQTSVAGWTNATSGTGVPFGNVQSPRTGRFAMQLSDTVAYNASVSQDLNVPNGTYALSVWVKSSGGQNSAKVFANNFGNSEKSVSVNTALSSWTQVTISDIVVTNGTIKIGVESDANAGNYVRFDDWNLIKQSVVQTNYILNDGFEADQAPAVYLSGWSTWRSGTGTPFGNILNPHTGNYAMQLFSTSDFNASMYQNIVIPNGTYTLKAWVKSSGGQKAATIYAKNYGVTGKSTNINTATSTWTQITIPGIVVTKGQIQVGIWSDAYANNWVNVDDVTLTKD